MNALSLSNGTAAGLRQAPPRTCASQPQRRMSDSALTCALSLSKGIARRDQALHPVVGGDEGILAEHCALRLVIQLQVHPVDGVVVTALLRSTDEVASKLGPRGLSGTALARKIAGSVVTRAARPRSSSRENTP